MAKKITAELVALADYAMNSEDKKLSIIGIFDKLFVRSLPAAHPKLVFVTTLMGESNTEEKLTMKIVLPSGKEEFSADVNVKFGENGKANLISNFEGFPIKEAGTYHFFFGQNGKEVVGQDLHVIMVKDQNGNGVKN